MKPEQIDSFLNSTVSTFDAMLGCTLIPREPFVRRRCQPEHEVCGIIGLSGKAKGTVMLCLGRDAALSVTGAMLGMTVTEIDSNVTDAIGELTNIIAGVSTVVWTRRRQRTRRTSSASPRALPTTPRQTDAHGKR
jgi:chemotaxis protein CheX